MSLSFIFIIFSMLICFVIPAIWYKKVADNNGVFNRGKALKSSIFLPIFIPVSICLIFAYLAFYNPADFVNSLSLWQIVATFGGALAVYIFGYMQQLKKFFPLIILFFALLCTVLADDKSVDIFPSLPIWLNRGLLALLWTVFSLAYRYTNSGNAMLAIQSGFISLGIGLLGLMGAIPFLASAGGWISFAAFLALLVFSWYPSKIVIGATTASSLGFLLFGIASMVIFENAFSCIVVFSMFFFVDVAWSWMYKLSFIDKFSSVYANTAFSQTVSEGMHPAQAALFSVRIQAIMLFLGCFQVFSPVKGSLIIFSFIICIWLSYKYRTLSLASNSLKAINSQLIEELQQQVDEVKKYVGRDSPYSNRDDEYNGEDK